MSSDEEGLSGGQTKKRKVQRACDICRRKKIRCDGVQTAGNSCSNCIAADLECTYVETAKKRGPPKAYVEAIEDRIEKMENLIREIIPDEDLAKELGNFTFNRETWSIGNSNSPGVTRSSSKEQDFSDTGGEFQTEDIFRAPSVIHNAANSGCLTRLALDLKVEFTGESLDSSEPEPEESEHYPWQDLFDDDAIPKLEFPEDDLMNDLIDIYFNKVNVLLPLLHRPTFEKDIADKLHLRDGAFAGVLLLVCANASRHSDDPRVLLPGSDSWLSCGWRWFVQIELVYKTFLNLPKLHNLQFNCLYCVFLQGSSAPHSCWTMIGIGLRMAQYIGAHRRRETHTVEDELTKRAFWCLLTIDRHVSAYLGRPCVFQDEDYDLDMPADCDDEYWEHPDPTLAFRQPPERPSYVAFFISYLKLVEILAAILRTLYCVNKSKVLLGFMEPDWEQRVVAELDLALNRWVDGIPDHLRWDPQLQDTTFFNQSSVLYTSFYNLQILIHRQFTRKSSPVFYPSLAICTNAARSLSHIVDVVRIRGGYSLPWAQSYSFTAGVVLLLNIWGGKRSGLTIDPVKEMSDVHKCMQALQVCEKRWHMAGRSWDVMCELATVGQLPLPQSSPTSQNKRERGSDSPISGSSSCGSVSDLNMSGTRNIASSKRVYGGGSSVSGVDPGSIESQEVFLHRPGEQQLFPLPMSSDDLGRLPLHGQLNYTSKANLETLDAQGAVGGYWFSGRDGIGITPQEVPIQSASTGPSHYLDLPVGYPELADAEFFEQLTAMSWPNSRGYGGQEMAIPDGAFAPYHQSTAAWSDAQGVDRTKSGWQAWASG